MDATKITAAIEAGSTTRKEIADAVGKHPDHMSRVLNTLVEEGVLEKERDGRSYVYAVAEAESEEESEAQPAQESEDGEVALPPVNRNYDWDEYVPDLSEVPEYVAPGSEVEEIMATIENRDITQEEINILLSGHTGTGKTSLVEYVCALLGIPLFEIQMTYDMSPGALVGRLQMVGQQTVWVDNNLTKALLCSQERTCAVLIDETNRAMPQVHSTVMSALDGRCRLVLDNRGGEVIQGTRNNLLVFSTINEGREYTTEEMDPAHKRRYKAAGEYEIPYLGLHAPEKEAEVIASRSPADLPLAGVLVEMANELREKADDPTSEVRVGVPTSVLLAIARKAKAFDNAGLGNPLTKAAERVLVTALYDEGVERTTVRNDVQDKLDGVPFDLSEQEEERVGCTQCEWEATVSEAEVQGAMDFEECPECAAHIKPVEAAQ